VNGDGADDYLLSSYAPGSWHPNFVDGPVGILATGLRSPFVGYGIDDLCPPSTSSIDCEAKISYGGTTSPTYGQDLTVLVEHLPESAPVMFVWGRGSFITPLSSGYLCFGGPNYRLGIQRAGSGAAPCPNGSVSTGNAQRPISKAELASFGVTAGHYIRAIYRDSGAPPGQDMGTTGAMACTMWP